MSDTEGDRAVKEGVDQEVTAAHPEDVGDDSKAHDQKENTDPPDVRGEMSPLKPEELPLPPDRRGRNDDQGRSGRPENGEAAGDRTDRSERRPERDDDDARRRSSRDKDRGDSPRVRGSAEPDRRRADREAERSQDRDRADRRGRDRGKERSQDRERTERRGGDRDHEKERSQDRDRAERRGGDRDKERSQDRGRRRSDREKERSRDREREPRRERSRDRDRERRSDRDRSDRDRSDRDRDRDRDRHREHDRGSGRERERGSGRDWEREPERGSGRHDRDDRDRDRDKGGRSREDGGYQPRRRAQRSPDIPKFVDPFAHLRAANAAQGMAATTKDNAKNLLAEQQAKARQLVLQQQATSAAAAASKTQREVYVGNLTQGKVTEQALRQLFDAALTRAFPLVAAGRPPVMNVAMHSEGRYAFVELASSEMATAALQLSGQLDFLGSQITVGRPSGYIDPAKAAAAAAAANKALLEYGDDGKLRNPAGAAALPGPPSAGVLKRGDAPPAVDTETPCICIENMVREVIFAEENEYQDTMEDLREECTKHGEIRDIRIPRPDDPASQMGHGCWGKVYVLMADAEQAAGVRRVLHGRMYDSLQLCVTCVEPGLFYQLPF